MEKMTTSEISIFNADDWGGVGVVGGIKIEIATGASYAVDTSIIYVVMVRLSTV